MKKKKHLSAGVTSFHTTGHIREMRLRVENCWMDHLDVIEKMKVIVQHFNVLFFFFAI